MNNSILNAIKLIFDNTQKLHAAGKTEEARADLARLAIIRKQREDAAKKREEDQKGAFIRYGNKTLTELLCYLDSQ